VLVRRVQRVCFGFAAPNNKPDGKPHDVTHCESDDLAYGISDVEPDCQSDGYPNRVANSNSNGVANGLADRKSDDEPYSRTHGIADSQSNSFPDALADDKPDDKSNGLADSEPTLRRISGVHIRVLAFDCITRSGSGRRLCRLRSTRR
jgi:hypothetical protein